MTQSSPMDDAVDLLTVRYKVAFDAYQDILEKNAELNRTGDHPSQQGVLEEERAFEKLDLARQALLDAAAVAYPTVH
jgi:hypothetical protein